MSAVALGLGMFIAHADKSGDVSIPYGLSVPGFICIYELWISGFILLGANRREAAGILRQELSASSGLRSLRASN